MTADAENAFWQGPIKELPPKDWIEKQLETKFKLRDSDKVVWKLKKEWHDSNSCPVELGVDFIQLG